MTCALIITTYNWKEALELVLLSALNQSELPEEIIIADDGSRNDTKELIENFAKNSSVPIIHSWQEDEGFRAASSRNKAIAKAKSNYIVLIDGDMILHKDFIKEHKLHAKEKQFIQGSRVLIQKEKSKTLIQDKKYSISPFDSGIKNRKNTIHNKTLSSIFSKNKNSLAGIKTCNMSFFKADCFDINGFNEDFIGWGREDSEFVVRLLNNGIKRKNIKFNCIAYHIWHNENPRANLTKNDALLKKSIDENLKYCQNGIKKYLGENSEY
jgi:glycosyltransferase involved in cell wall biosynthesis